MAKTKNQKLKILYTLDFLYKESVLNHKVTTSDIIDYLSSCGIAVERKTVYTDLEALREYGFNIVSTKRKATMFYKLTDGHDPKSERMLKILCGNNDTEYIGLRCRKQRKRRR